MQKKYLYIAVIVLCASCFWAGSAGAGKRADVLADRIGELQGQLDSSIELVGTLREANSKLVRINSNLESENIQLGRIVKELQEINERFNKIIKGISESNSNTRQGIEEAETGISGVIERIRKTIKKSEAEEPDNNH